MPTALWWLGLSVGIPCLPGLRRCPYREIRKLVLAANRYMLKNVSTKELRATVAGVSYDSPLAIFCKVARRIFPERVFGSRGTA